MFGDMARYEMAEASLLASTPAIAREKKPQLATTQEWHDTRLYLETRLAALRNWRLSWWEYWARLAENILPRRYHWLITPNSMTRGLPINQAILDTTPIDAVNVCAAGMTSGLTNPARPWFKLKVGIKGFEPDYESQVWLDQVQSRVYDVLAGSNFYDSMSQMNEDLSVFGTAPILIYEHPQSLIHLFNPCAGEYYLAVGPDFKHNTLYRTFVLTVIQMVEQFGLENCPDNVQQLWNQKGASLDTEYVVAHAIEPNFPAAMPGQKKTLAVVAGGFVFREYYWIWGVASERPLSVRGFRESPFIAPTWKRTSNDPYGRSPGMDALGDIVQLHVMTRRLNEAIEKMVRPPMQADAKLRNEPSSTLPGKITYVTDVEKGGMRPIYVIDPKIEHMVALIKELQAKVQRRFFNDQFLMISQMEGVQPRNELEIAERRGEKLQVLGPVVESQQGQLSLLLRRVVAIMDRRKLLPPKPKALANLPIEIEYISMFSLAQKAAQTAAMERSVAMAGRMEGVWPGTIDNVEPNKFWRDYATKLGFPSDDMRSLEEVQKMQQAKQQQQQGQQGIQEAASMAPVAADTAATLSETDTGGGLSALQVLLGDQAAPQVGMQ